MFVNYPYRRPAWLQVLGIRPPVNSYTAPETKPWVPSTHLLLDDVISLLGKSMIEGWVGGELIALYYKLPPDPPWHWPGSETPAEHFLIDEQNEVVVVSEEEAVRWWERLEPQLLGRMEC